MRRWGLLMATAATLGLMPAAAAQAEHDVHGDEDDR